MIPRATAVINQGRQMIGMAHMTGWRASMRDTMLKTMGFMITHPTAVKISAAMAVGCIAVSIGYYLKQK